MGAHLRDDECIDLFRVVSLVGPVRIMLDWIVCQVIQNTSDPFLLMVEFGLFSEFSYPAELVAELCWLNNTDVLFRILITITNYFNYQLLIIKHLPCSSLCLRMFYDLLMAFIICLSHNIFTWIFGPS